VLHPHPGHSKANCLKILRRLSAFIDDELPADVCKEVRKHLGACPNCELFVGSLQQTIGLCRHAEPRPLSSRLRSRIRRHVLNSVGRY
jgi:anti-sigma factor RsiW